MVKIPDYVLPGDIVESLGHNNFVDVLRDITQRLTLLESGGAVGNGVAITSLAPAGDLRVGQEVTIFGRNFGFSIGAHRVFFDSSRVKVFKTGSTDEKLIIEIPEVSGVTESGTSVTLTAANFTSSDSRLVTLRPVKLNQQGNVALSFLNVTPTTITVGSKPKFKYQLDAPVMLPQLVTIEPTVSIASLQGSIKVLDASDQELAGRQLTLQPGQSTQISVQLEAIPPGTTQFALDVKVTGSGIAGSEDNRNFPLNAVIDTDQGVPIFTPNVSSPPGALQGNTLSVAAGATVTVQFRAEFTGNDTRTYDVLAPTASGWTIVRSQSFQFSTPATYLISGPDTKFPAFDVTPTAGATSPINVEFTLQRQGSTKKKTVQLTLTKT
jgi:IPT/TIG domain-containing protein